MQSIVSHLMSTDTFTNMDDAPDVAPAGGALVAIAADEMDTALQWIGFENAPTHERLRAEGFESFDDLKSMKEKDIRDLADSYWRRTAADG